MQLADPVVSRFKGTIDSCQNCSAKLLKNVSEVFYYAVKAVINPLAPIFNPEAENGDGALTALCAKALKRIFLINDRDKVIPCEYPHHQQLPSSSPLLKAEQDTM